MNQSYLIILYTDTEIFNAEYIFCLLSYRYVRRFVVSQACKYGNIECIGNATKLFKQLMDNPPDAVNP